MSILRRDLEDLLSLRDVMDRLVVDPLARPLNWVEERLGKTIALDMYETDTEYVLKAVLPGVKPEDLDVSVLGDVLTIKGEIQEETELEEACYICHERRSGTLSRSITLPNTIDVEGASAQFANGILTLTLPKSEAVKPKVIQVNPKK